MLKRTGIASLPPFASVTHILLVLISLTRVYYIIRLEWYLERGNRREKPKSWTWTNYQINWLWYWCFWKIWCSISGCLAWSKLSCATNICQTNEIRCYFPQAHRWGFNILFMMSNLSYNCKVPVITKKSHAASLSSLHSSLPYCSGICQNLAAALRGEMPAADSCTDVLVGNTMCFLFLCVKMPL